MTKYYELKSELYGKSTTRWTDDKNFFVGNTGTTEEDAEVLTGREVEIDDNFRVQGDRREWNSELQARAVATAGK